MKNSSFVPMPMCQFRTQIRGGGGRAPAGSGPGDCGDEDAREDPRQRSRLGAPKAITATAHKMARIVDNVMRYGGAYQMRELDAYAAEVWARLEKSLHRRAKELGYEVRKIEPPVETMSAEALSSA